MTNRLPRYTATECDVTLSQRLGKWVRPFDQEEVGAFHSDLEWWLLLKLPADARFLPNRPSSRSNRKQGVEFGAFGS